MAHPHGIVACFPHNQFHVPRSYVYKLHVATNHVNSVSYADGLITWGHVPPDAVSGETKIKDNFIAWNSNVYTLDYLVEWWFYKIAPSPTEFEWGGDCRFEYDPVVKCNVITIATLAVDTDYYFDLPPAPPDYWTPPPL